MHDHLTTTSLVVLALLAAVASVLALSRLRPGGKPTPRSPRPQRLLLALCGVGSLALFIYRALVVHQGWEPLQAHVDGLLLIAAFVAATAMFLQAPSRVPGIDTFALPVLTILLTWAICASSFTLEGFAIHSVWNTVHLSAVYLGACSLALAAGAGGCFLYAQKRLRSKAVDPNTPIASLETLETLIVRSSALGFALLSLGLITGLVIVTSIPDNKLGDGWWYSPKIVLAFSVWLIYALITNVRHTTTFRGARAAWLSIAGLVLLLATFGVVTSMGRNTKSDARNPNETNPKSEIRNLNETAVSTVGDSGLGHSDLLSDFGFQASDLFVVGRRTCRS